MEFAMLSIIMITVCVPLIPTPHLLISLYSLKDSLIRMSHLWYSAWVCLMWPGENEQFLPAGVEERERGKERGEKEGGSDLIHKKILYTNL